MWGFGKIFDPTLRLSLHVCTCIRVCAGVCVDFPISVSISRAFRMEMGFPGLFTFFLQG